jgi:allantoate deiminase
MYRTGRGKSLIMAPSISASRILGRCDALAACSESTTALTRVFLSAEQRAASDQVLGWMRDAGMQAKIDAIGNVVGRYESAKPGAPCLMLGSHLDTVRDAGRYDGMLGVVSAIECVHALHSANRRFPFAIEVVGFADEEGTRFGATLLGSRAMAGTFDNAALSAVDRDGTTIADALKAFGLDSTRISDAAKRAADVLAYVELHIEQGPVLEAENLAVGVVTAINGATRFSIEIEGMAGHAGTVPMNLRHDALAAAAECVLAVEQRCVHEPELVGTVGKMEALPGAVNVIPGKARFTLDIRAPHDARRLTAVQNVLTQLHEICRKRSVTLSTHKIHESAVALCAPWLITQIGAALAAENIAIRQLPSGAGHDGMAMISLCDIGMLFVRCKGGISHHPAEAVTADDVETSARVLLRFIENFRPRD